ncbi:MAG: hypothetical protein Q8O82_08560 [Pseudorhodobacter sp.]|nr:hypothetical protein [Pseudorhodobacter sp.]
MISFDHFQRATCLISEGDMAGAAVDLQAALRKLDADPKHDPSLRANLDELLAVVSINSERRQQ